MKHTYKFSIVCAVYNTARYLEEMIESVLMQNIGFEENVQLILVDDGSEDNSLEVCRKYEAKYPYNIMVRQEDHHGVSYARNKGLEFAKGEYVNFLDSDDKLERNALHLVEQFYKIHDMEVDVVAIPLKFFDAELSEHVLNNKFSKTKVIDVNEQYDYIQLSSSSAFIKRKALGYKRFDEQLKYGEDAKLITDLIMEKGKYGAICETSYLYRRRGDQSSATQTLRDDKEWYIDHLRYFSLDLLERYKDINKTIPKYIQFIVMYDLQYKFTVGNLNKSGLTAEEQKEWINLMYETINQIESRIILKQKQINIKYKLIILAFKILNRWDIKKLIQSQIWYREEKSNEHGI